MYERRCVDFSVLRSSANVMRLGLKLHQKGHMKLDCASEEEEEKARTFRVEFV
jgi:hypothetical protein